MSDKVTIRRLATGVPGLDAILGGGLPEFSFNMIAGSPGSGKTTLAHQIMFALATPERPALFFTVLGEPPMKMLRYQQQFLFFNPDKINTAISFVNLTDELATGDFNKVLARIIQEVETRSPALVFMDSFRGLMEAIDLSGTSNRPQQFAQQLAAQLSAWQATTFLVGEYASDNCNHPVFTVADGLISLQQSVHRNSIVRKICVLKMRGQPTSPGLHTFRISGKGLEIFPSAVIRDDSVDASAVERAPPGGKRLSIGVPKLDTMLGGGLPEGFSLLVAGPSGSGKTILATAFLAEGMRCGEPGVLVAFEQTPSQSLSRTVDDMVRAGHVGLINTRSLGLSIDEIVQHLISMVHRMKATRVVIDSLSGFELAVAPTFREDFRESLFRMAAALSGLGVTVMMTSELEDRYTDLRFSPYGSAFLTDAIIVQRYIEIDSSPKRVLAVVKVRDSAHSKEIREFEIKDARIEIGAPLLEYEGLLASRPTRTPVSDAATSK